MPTGYTSDIYEGKEVSMSDYLIKCARAFGAAITMRDEPLDKSIPVFEPNPYYKENLDKERIKYDHFLKMTDDEIRHEIDVMYDEQLESCKRLAKESQDRLKRYESILKELNVWDPPTVDHIELKNFAISQIGSSIKTDCIYSDYCRYPQKPTVEEWKSRKLKDFETNIEYYSAKWNEEVLHTKNRNKWVNDLKMSLGL
ncbi:hypothetical protein [Bacillus atrophaeus]|uniref:hypothetical protein n=1 Tax=Bacillus atrophaeus TaxID=1452 RepID=UPI001C120D65|nr:hypothetical protein [Bacillus atrophaeus]MBU5262067.1 hypothetical protein [Bacillus atrophaeus]